MAGEALFHKCKGTFHCSFLHPTAFPLICVCLGREKFLSISVTTKKSHRNPGPKFQHLCPLQAIAYVNISRSGHCLGLPFHTCSLSTTDPLLPAPWHIWVTSPRPCPVLLHFLMLSNIPIKGLRQRYKISLLLLL